MDGERVETRQRRRMKRGELKERIVKRYETEGDGNFVGCERRGSREEKPQGWKNIWRKVFP